MARLLFTVETGRIPELQRWNALVALETALEKEFPAFQAGPRVIADTVAAVVVRNVTEVPDEAWTKLDGWGHGMLRLELV